MARQRNETTRDRRIQVLMRSMDERRAMEEAADAAGLPVSTWARRTLLEAVGLPTDESPEAEAGRALRSHRED